MTSDRTRSPDEINASLHELLDIVEQVERGIDEATRLAQAAADASYQGRSADGHVHATVSGDGSLIDLSCEPRWLRQAHEMNIARQINSAIRNAYAAATRNSVRDAAAGGSLGEVQRLLRDPAQLARKLRLSD